MASIHHPSGIGADNGSGSGFTKLKPSPPIFLKALPGSHGNKSITGHCTLYLDFKLGGLDSLFLIISLND